MNTVDDVFKSFDEKSGTNAFAEALGLKLSTASEMRRRSSIPVRYWATLVDAARQRGISDLSFDRLVAIHTRDKKRARHRREPAGAAQ